MGKASEIWKEIKPKIGEMLVVVNNIETQAEKAQEEAYQKGVQDTKQHWADFPRTCAYKLGYENGLNDAWEAARKIVLSRDDGGIEYEAKKEIFGHTNYNIIRELTVSEVIEKIRQYEQEKDRQARIEYNCEEIKDVINTTMMECNVSLDEIATVLDKMRGENND